MTALPVRKRRATTWIVFGVVALLAAVGAVLAVGLLRNLQTGTGGSASPSLLASGRPTISSSSGGASATPQASSAASSTPDQTASAAWAATGNMIEARSNPTATLLIDGQVLVAGGSGSSGRGALDFAEVYDPGSGSWAATGSMAEARSYGHTASLLRDGSVLVAGGEVRGSLCSPTPCRGSPSQPTASAELYDPNRGTWRATGEMAAGRSLHTATLLPDGKVLVTGGGTGIDPSGFDSLASAELYDPSSGTWTATGSMAEVRFGHTATLLRDGRVLVAGGFGRTGALASAELFDPGSGTWTATGKMNAGRAKYTATLLLDGRVLVVGLGPLASAELYDPGSGTWTATGSMHADRGIHTATLLRDGRVLVAGGGSRGEVSPRPLFAELYDPGSASWTATPNVVTPREGQSATLLLDGKVLIAGGSGGSGANYGALASAELYDPASGN